MPRAYQYETMLKEGVARGAYDLQGMDEGRLERWRLELRYGS